MDEDVATWPLWREVCLIATCSSAQLLTQASLAQVLVPLSTIGDTFDIAASPGELSWTIAAYSLTVGIFVLPAGRLGDIYGRT
jgi:MFS family permease